MSDLIDRQAAIDALEDKYMSFGIFREQRAASQCIDVIKNLPSAQPEMQKIGYDDCANAMLKMWMDNVVTDGEYNRIMDRLNAHWGDEEWKWMT